MTIAARDRGASTQNYTNAYNIDTRLATFGFYYMRVSCTVAVKRLVNKRDCGAYTCYMCLYGNHYKNKWICR